MTVQDLIEALEDFESDTEVRLAHQPSWPFEYSIDSVVEADPDEEYEMFPATIDGVQQYEVRDQDREVLFEAPTKEECESWIAEQLDGESKCVYIGEGAQLGYLPGFASKALGWK